jgi:hypothetical protein
MSKEDVDKLIKAARQVRREELDAEEAERLIRQQKIDEARIFTERLVSVVQDKIEIFTREDERMRWMRDMVYDTDLRYILERIWKSWSPRRLVSVPGMLGPRRVEAPWPFEREVRPPKIWGNILEPRYAVNYFPDQYQSRSLVGLDERLSQLLEDGFQEKTTALNVFGGGIYMWDKKHDPIYVSFGVEKDGTKTMIYKKKYDHMSMLLADLISDYLVD